MWDTKTTKKNKHLERLEEVEFGTKSKSKKYVEEDDDDEEYEEDDT